ncbi:MAG: bacterial Ig-like domain-containing protein, partial [Clostridia bacterium]|nr:bacterial Ig-like domain-containing protein [Clostridia bacterium]
MKRKVSLIIATVMMLSILCANLVGCQLGAVPTAIVVDGGYESAYFVGDAFDYDNVMIKVTYDDGSQEIKSVKDLGATYTEADMSTAGVKSVTFNYEGLSSMITFKVIIDGGENAFDDVVERISAPKYYQNYLTTIASTTNTDA